MSRKSRLGKYAKEKRDPGPFVALPIYMINSNQFIALSAHAIKLLVDLLSQYHGNNNGDLCATWSLMHTRRWKSRDTLAKALRELVDAGFVAQTRQGGMHAASLYGVTFYAMDPSSKFDVTDFPRGKWSRTEPGAGSPTRPKKHCSRHALRVDFASISTVGVSDAVHKSQIHTARVSVKTLRRNQMTRLACTSIALPSPAAARPISSIRNQSRGYSPYARTTIVTHARHARPSQNLRRK
jgi:hypothetical protein